MATYDVYELGGAKLGTLTVFDATWQRRANEPGFGRATVHGDVPAALLASDTYIRVNDGTRDVAAWFPIAKPRMKHGRSSRVHLSGQGLAVLWDRALIYPESNDRPVDVRWYGPMSKDYTPDADWIGPTSLGQHGDFPFGEDRGPGFADRTAHLVGYTDSQDLTDEQANHRVEFTLDEDTEVFIQAYADDFYRTWLDAAPLRELATPERPHNWKTVQEWSGVLSAGVHVLYFEFGNLVTPYNAGQNPLYVAWSVMRTAGNGDPAASHHAVNVLYSGTSGYWQGFVDGKATAQIDWDATKSEIEAAFDAVLGDGEVTAEGSTGSWTVTLAGPTTGYTPHAVSVDGTVAGLALQTASYGASADFIAHSDASTGLMLPPGSGVKGLDAHEILSSVRSEEIARGATLVEHIAMTSTSPGVDTAGNDLPEHVIEVSLSNATGLRVWELLVEAGDLLDVSPEGVQQIWAPAGRGQDRSATVIYTVGDGATSLEADQDLSGLVNVLRFTTEDGWDETSDAASITEHGRAGQVIRLDSYDPTGADQFTPHILEDLKDPLDPVSLEVPASHDLVPEDAFVMGDLIVMPAWSPSGFVATTVRVVEVSGYQTGRTHRWVVRGIS